MPPRNVRTVHAAKTNPGTARRWTRAARDAGNRSAPTWFFEIMKAPDESQSGAVQGIATVTVASQPFTDANMKLIYYTA
jgi:hypothetical protein